VFRRFGGNYLRLEGEWLWFPWMHHREPKLVILKMETVRSSEKLEHFTTRRRNPKKKLNDLASHFRFAQLLSLGEGWGRDMPQAATTTAAL
jgi:hypothetical protein